MAWQDSVETSLIVMDTYIKYCQSGFRKKGLQRLFLVLVCSFLSMTYLLSAMKDTQSESMSKGRSESKIKFYLYPLEYFPSFWGTNSTCDHSKVLTPKHDGYIYAINTMKRHPWRTSNPREAMLAFLPISVDVYSRGGCPGLNDNNILKELKQVLANSTIFPMIRHVFIAHDYKSNKLAAKISLLLKPAGIWMAMSNRGDCKSSLPQNTNYASFMSMRDPNSYHMPSPAPFGSDRIYSVNMVGQFDERVEYKERVALFTSKGQQIPHSFITTAYRKEMKYDLMIKKGFHMTFKLFS